MKITVFGGAGFLGSHVSDKLSDAGHEVTVADIVESRWIKSSQKIVIGDILDSKFVKSACENAEMVFNFAGIADIEDANKSPFETARTNILGNIRILEECAKLNIQRYIFASSMYIYGQYGGFYRCSKQASESFIEEFSSQFNLKYTILRYGSLYGKRSNPKNGIYNFIYNAMNNNKIIYYGNKDSMREYIHVEDAAISTIEILKPEYENSHIILTGPQLMKISDIFLVIKEILGKDIDIQYKNQSGHHYTVTPYKYSHNTAKKLFPHLVTDFGQGVIEIINEIKMTT